MPAQPLRIVLLIVILNVLLLAFTAWAPWISETSAQNAVTSRFEDAWEGVVDGCGLNCNGCGPVEAWRVPFGVRVRLKFACGLIPADLPEYHEQEVYFVSFLGAVHGLPDP